MNNILYDPWIITIISGIIVTIIGGYFLHRILKRKKSNSHKFTSKGKTKSDGNIIIGNVNSKSNNHDSEHIVNLKKNSDTTTKGDIIVGDKQDK